MIYTTTEAARQLGITRWRVHQLITDGTIPAEHCRKAGRDWLLDDAALEHAAQRRGRGRPVTRPRKETT